MNAVESPVIPKEMLSKVNREITSQSVAFLYMDEKYANTDSPAALQATSLTGFLLSASVYPVFRNRLYRILPGFADGVDNYPIQVHASDLFRDRADEDHFEFYGDLVSLVNELGCRIFRRGFNFSPGHRQLRRYQHMLLRFCFKSMLAAVQDLGDAGLIWPVMETDRTDVQDEMFAGYVRWTDHATSYLDAIGDGVQELIEDGIMVDNNMIGDMHYVSKRSIIGSVVDCLAYLLHCRWIQDSGGRLSNYKVQLVDIARRLDQSLLDDHVVRYVTD